MATTSMLRFKGLHTYNSFLSEIPEGALSIAENVNIDRLSTLESRRGLKQYGTIGSTTSDVAKQLLLYKNRTIAHYSNALAYDNGSGTYTAFTGSFIETESGLRLKSIEQNGNLFLTTSTGIRKIAAKSASLLSSAKISTAGGIKALGGTAVVDYVNEGFFEGYSKIAYRIVWGTKDINNNLILGSPSTPIEVVNQNSVSGTATVTFAVPQNITTDYFYRIYRTGLFTATTFADVQYLTVDDEYRLVYEDGYISGTEITINDIVPEDFRQGGAPLYTNESSGEGILQSNEAPPFAKDIAAYKNSAFFANTRTTYRQLIDMVGLGDFERYGASGDTIDITSITYLAPTTTIVFSAATTIVAGQKIVITNSGSATLDGIRTVATSVGNTITITADGTGASATNASVYPSSLIITKNTTRQYYFVGRPEIHSFTFPAYYAGIDQTYFLINAASDAVKYTIYFHDTAGPIVEPNTVETAGTLLIKVDVSSADTTGTLIADKVMVAINDASYDFVIDGTTATRTISTANSGSATNPVITTLSPVTGLTTTAIQDGDGENGATNYVRLSSLASPSQRIDDTARSLCKIVSADTSGEVNAYYLSGPQDAPGKMNFESRILDTTPFTLQSNVGQDFSPSITSPLTATNEEKANRVYFSKTSQPEAVPIVNYFDVGPQDSAILRILGLRDSLFIIKEDGIYRLTGENPTNFFVTLFDGSCNVSAPDTCVVIDNNIFGLSSQGVVRISETGIDIISQPVQDAFNLYTSPRYTYYKTASFGAAYVEDYAYICWLPKNATDTTGTIAYRFSTKTETWTTWKKVGNAKCAIVNTSTNKLFVGPDDINIVEIERKDLKRTDFADREYSLDLLSNSISGTTISVPSLLNVEPGDVLSQTQYVTASLVDRLANKFVLDAGVPNTVGNDNKNYYRNLTINPGDNLQDVLGSVITQLNSDIGTAYQTLYSLDAITFQTEYNNLINLLNADTTLLHTNYSLSVNPVIYEVFITSIDKKNISVTVDLMMPLVVGSLTHYKSISCNATLAPYFFGDPAILKHVRDATVRFATASLTRGTVGYNTDLSANFDDIEFTMEGTGNWGTWVFDSIAWGGEGTGRPFRTLIPKNKQRCTYIRTRFLHKAAFDEFRILGISYSFEGNSERAYR